MLIVLQGSVVRQLEGKVINSTTAQSARWMTGTGEKAHRSGAVLFA
jgi:hypothetical protein